MNRDDSLTVVDIFCGAGGFSEGFRQHGFKIILGIDSWQPAIDTFNYNFRLNCGIKNVFDFECNDSAIEDIPDSDIIIGSPPCVTFSTSNKSGNADKSVGMRLIKIFLSIIAVKKHKKGGRLKAWYMENVVNSLQHLSDYYTFSELGLDAWATKNNINPSNIAISIKDNFAILNACEYGCPQNRKRAFCGEIISLNRFNIPRTTHKSPKERLNLPDHLTLGYIKASLPSPSSPSLKHQYVYDPNYPHHKVNFRDLTDHFYDTGLYESIWRYSKYLKQNHPYMGRMSFPEDMSRPSRTITATKIGSSREALIFKSEHKRFGDGEYRTGTIREAATLMSFPISYQFLGSENTKWRLVGNAVCPKLSGALAKDVLAIFDKPVSHAIHHRSIYPHPKLVNLNTYKQKSFDSPPLRKPNSRFRRHPIKEGNITVTLSNYDIKSNSNKVGKWRLSIQYGTGEGYPVQNIRKLNQKTIETIILGFEGGDKFIQQISNGFSQHIAPSQMMQSLHHSMGSSGVYWEPTRLIDHVSDIINSYTFDDDYVHQSGPKIFKYKSKIPKRQYLALYALNTIVTITNG